MEARMSRMPFSSGARTSPYLLPVVVDRAVLVPRQCRYSPEVVRTASSSVVIPSRALLTASSPVVDIPSDRAVSSSSCAFARRITRRVIPGVTSMISKPPPGRDSPTCCNGRTPPPHEGPRIRPGRDAGALEYLFRGGVGNPTLGAIRPQQRLADDRPDRRSDEERLLPHVDQPGDRPHRVIGVEGGEDKVSRQGRADRQLDGLRVPHLPDEDNVGVVPEDGPQSRGEGHPRLHVDLALPDDREFVLHRVLERDDTPVERVDVGEGG